MPTGYPSLTKKDQGSEYKADNLNKILKSNKIKQSMSNKSSPWQNGFERRRFISGKTA